MWTGEVNAPEKSISVGVTKGCSLINVDILLYERTKQNIKTLNCILASVQNKPVKASVEKQ